MAGFFPQVTGTFKLEEPPAIRRLSMSIVEMAVITGVLLRVYRALALTIGPERNLLYASIMFGVGLAFLFGMATLHLGNFTIRHWLWRAPLFAAIEAAVEVAASAALIAIHREPMGSARAAFADWPRIASGIVFFRVLGIVLFALILAGVVQFVRYSLLRHEHRDHTVSAIQHETASHEQPKG
jgi:hypothetical protein